MEKLIVVMKKADEPNQVEFFEKKGDTTKFINKLKKSEEKLKPADRTVSHYGRSEATQEEYDAYLASTEEE